MPRSALWKQRHKRKRDEDVGGAFPSVRDAYHALGAPGFYEQHGAAYHNPHEALLCSALPAALDAWLGKGVALSPAASSSPWRVLDVACGGGEATIAFESWLATHPKHSAAAAATIDACDPYTAARYTERTGRSAECWSFAQIAEGILGAREHYDLTLASFCLHLLGPADLAATLAALARASRWLLVATPHKRLEVEACTGWRPAATEAVHRDMFDCGSTRHRVRLRLYRSTAV